MPKSPTKKIRSIAVRLEDEDFRFLELLAERLELPTDGRPIIGRAVQEILRVMRTSIPRPALIEQGIQGQQGQRCLTPVLYHRTAA